MLTICVLVGLPASGKSSFAREIILTPFHKIVYSFDDTKLQNDNYKVFRRRVQEQLFRIIQDEVEKETTDHKVLIIDDVMTYRSMRYEIFRNARKLNSIGFCQIHLKTDLETCILRNRQRESSEVTEEMIRDQDRRLEPPGISNSLMDKFFLEIYNNKYDQEQIISLIDEAGRHPIPPASDKTAHSPSDQSIVHQIDLILRKQISLSISRVASAEQKKQLAEELNYRRQELLQDIRNKTVVFEEPFQEVVDFL